jgi:hypothetical protein
MADETVIKFGVKGVEKAQARIQQVNRAYVALNQEITKTGRLIQNLYRRNDEKGKQQVDHLRDAYKRLSQQVSATKKDIAALNYASGGPAEVGSGPNSKGSPPPNGRERGGRNLSTFPRAVRSIGSFATRSALYTGGLMGLTGLGAFTAAIFSAKEYGSTLSDLGKELRLSGTEYEKFDQLIKSSAGNLRLTNNEAERLAKTYATITGTAEGFEIPGGFARAYGLNPEAATSIFGRLAQLGAAGPSKQGMSDFAGLIAEAIVKGGMQGREIELLRTLTGLVARQTQTLTQVSHGGVNYMLSTMTAMNRYGPPGLRGEHGGQFLQAFNAGVENPGGGPTGKFLLAKAIGAQNWFDLEYLKEEGLFGNNLNIAKIMPFSKRVLSGGGKRQWAYLMKRWFPGATMHQFEAFDDLYGKIGDFGGLNRYVQGINRGKGLESVDPQKLSVIADLYQAKTPEEINRVLSRRELGLSDEEKRSFSGKSKDEIMKAVLDRATFLSKEEQLNKSLNDIYREIQGFAFAALPLLSKIAQFTSGAIQGFSGLLRKLGANDFAASLEEAMGVTPELKPAASLPSPDAAVSHSQADEMRRYYGLRSTEYAGRQYRKHAKRRGISYAQAQANYEKFKPAIAAAAEKYGVPVAEAETLIWIESGFDPDAVSPKGAAGLGQLMPGTARDLGLTDQERFDPYKNIDASIRYYAQVRKGRETWPGLAYAGYNAGPNGAVSRVREQKDIRSLPQETRVAMYQFDRELDENKLLGGPSFSRIRPPDAKQFNDYLKNEFVSTVNIYIDDEPLQSYTETGSGINPATAGQQSGANQSNSRTRTVMVGGL